MHLLDLLAPAAEARFSRDEAARCLGVEPAELRAAEARLRRELRPREVVARAEEALAGRGQNLRGARVRVDGTDDRELLREVCMALRAGGAFIVIGSRADLVVDLSGA
jgi:hypothetical protein